MRPTTTSPVHAMVGRARPTGAPLSVGETAETMAHEPVACELNGQLEDLLTRGAPPWAPSRREDQARMDRMADNPERIWCMSEVDIFADLDDAEMDALADAAPMKQFSAGSLIYSPHEPVETLFILKGGRVRIFRISPDGRALTTAIINPGTIFGEMVIVGQQMHDSFAEAMDDVAVCAMSRRDVQTLLLGDQRIAARISETLGRRLAQVERRLSDAIFKSVPERIAGTLVVMAASRPLTRAHQVHLTHEQLAALAGTSRETTTKVLGELADQGLIILGRGKITILDAVRLAELSGDQTV